MYVLETLSLKCNKVPVAVGRCERGWRPLQRSQYLLKRSSAEYTSTVDNPKDLCCYRQVMNERAGSTKEEQIQLLPLKSTKAKLDAIANFPQAEPEPTPGDNNSAELKAETETKSMQQCKTVSWIVIKFLVRALLFSIVVTCTVFSKLSLISLVSRLNETIDDIRINSTNDSEATLTSLHDRAAGFFWQLLFIILIPQFVNFFRALLFGVFKSGPWPTLRAILAVSQHCMISCMILMLATGGTRFCLPEMYICMHA